MSPRAGLNAQRITEVAADLADAIGFDDLTLSAVARTCGVRDPSLYVQVRNLHDLRVRVALLGVGRARRPHRYRGGRPSRHRGCRRPRQGGG